MVKIKVITLEMDRNLWEKFKKIMTKDKTLNDHVVELIEKVCEEKDNE